VNELIKAAMKFKRGDGRFAYVAPFYSQAKNVAWDYLKRFSAPIPGIKINESELRIDYPNGARIKLYGADTPDSLRGLFFDGLVADEYGDWKPSVWGYVIRPALADRGGWAIIIGTPKGRNQFWELYQRAEVSDQWLAMTLRASETGLLPATEIEALRQELTEDAFRQEMECDFEAALPGAFYGKELWNARESGRITRVEWQPDLPVHTAWDIGYRDDTAIWFYQIAGGEIHAIDFHASNGRQINFYTELIASKPYTYGTHWLPHDARAKTLASGGKSVIEQLGVGLGMENMAIVPHLDLIDGIQAGRRAVDIAWFDEEKCGEGLDALKQYQREWDEDKKCFRDKPRHDWTSHPSDAWRMLAIAWRQEEAKPVPKEPDWNNMQQPTFNDILEDHYRSQSRYRRI
jgi:hypothetical protein